MRLTADIISKMGISSTSPTPTPYIILAGQRTGSTWLRDVLGRHPEIASYGELMLEGGSGFPGTKYGPTDIEQFESWFRTRTPRGGRIARARNAIRYLEDFYDRRTEVRAIGFKLMYTQARRNPAVCGYIVMRRVRVLHLIRTNLLDILVSRATAAARSQPHAWGGEEVGDVQVLLDPVKTVALLTRLERQIFAARQFLRICKLPVLELKYEDLVANPERFQPALGFLGVSSLWAPTSSMQRLNRSPKSELVENWAELSQALSRTRYAQFLLDND